MWMWWVSSFLVVDTRRGMFPGCGYEIFVQFILHPRHSRNKPQMSRAGLINCISVPLILPTSPVGNCSIRAY